MLLRMTYLLFKGEKQSHARTRKNKEANGGGRPAEIGDYEGACQISAGNR